MQRFKSLFFVFAFLWISSAVAQTQFYTGLGFAYGLPVNQFDQSKSYLYGRAPSSFAGLDASLYVRFNHRIGLIAGIGQQYQYMSLRDKDFAQRYDGFVVNIKNETYYYNLFSQVQFLQSISSYGRTFLYVNAGFSFNTTGKGTLTETENFIIGNEVVTATSTYSGSNITLTGEAGVQFYISPKLLFNLGLSTQFGNSSLYQLDYKVTQASALVSQDQMTATGSYIGAKTSVYYKFHEISPKPKPLKPHPDYTPPPVVAQQDTVPKDTVKKVVEGREVVVTKKVYVKSNKLTIQLWDHQQIDGDIVSLNLNGEWILQNYTLEKKPKIIKIEIQPGENMFVLHALNLGKYSPNTAAIIISDGETDNKIILESNLQQSGTIDIIFTPSDK